MNNIVYITKYALTQGIYESEVLCNYKDLKDIKIIEEK